MELFSHDPYRHLKDLRELLSQNNKPIGFFISAGCPLSIRVGENECPLIPDVRGLSKLVSERLNEKQEYKKMIEELVLADRDNDNIEDILSFIRDMLKVAKGGNVRGLSEEDLKHLNELVCKEIGEAVNVELPSQETSYHKLVKWVGSIERRVPVEIFTTNYDLLMEQALDSLEIPYFDGFVGSRRPFFDLKAVENDLIPVHWTRLWKIHGSINWYDEVVNSRTKFYRSTELKSEKGRLIYPSHLKYDESRKMPYLALTDQLNRFLRKKSSFLIICGYSFGDEHLNGVIMNALKSNPTSMVLGLMFGEYLHEYELRYPKAYELSESQHNLNIWTFDEAIIGTKKGKWKSNNTLSESAFEAIVVKSEKTNEPASEKYLKLGDFSVFTDFLKRVIGIQGVNQHE